MPYLTSKEIQELGLIQEINRLVLHPRGLVLEAINIRDGHLLGDIQDHRANPVGVVYDEGDGETRILRASRFESLLNDRSSARESKYGYLIQPVNDPVFCNLISMESRK